MSCSPPSDATRAWLVYPYDPAVDSHQVRIERTRPEYAAPPALGVGVPDELEVARLSHAVLARAVPCDSIPNQNVRFRHGSRAFRHQVMIVMAVYPKVDKPYMFGLHQ